MMHNYNSTLIILKLPWKPIYDSFWKYDNQINYYA